VQKAKGEQSVRVLVKTVLLDLRASGFSGNLKI